KVPEFTTMHSKTALILTVVLAGFGFSQATAQLPMPARVSTHKLATSLSSDDSQPGVLRGTVELRPSGAKARNALITIAELDRSTLTDENGNFEFGDVPVGSYDVIAHLDRVPDVVKTVTVGPGAQTVDFELILAPLSEQVTVTASGVAEAVG